MSQLDFDTTFGEVVGSTFGRMAAFVATCMAAVTAVVLSVERWSTLELASLPLYAPIHWAINFGMGIIQVWGLLSYALLAVLLLAFLALEAPAARVLPWTFLIQSFEAMRCWMQADGCRFGWRLPSGVVVFLFAWLALAIILSLVTFGRRFPALAAGPFSFLAGRSEEEEEEDEPEGDDWEEVTDAGEGDPREAPGAPSAAQEPGIVSHRQAGGVEQPSRASEASDPGPQPG